MSPEYAKHLAKTGKKSPWDVLDEENQTARWCHPMADTICDLMSDKEWAESILMNCGKWTGRHPPPPRICISKSWSTSFSVSKNWDKEKRRPRNNLIKLAVAVEALP